MNPYQWEVASLTYLTTSSQYHQQSGHFSAGRQVGSRFASQHSDTSRCAPTPSTQGTKTQIAPARAAPDTLPPLPDL